jgi:DNA-binding NarL/FixJ family response regulator
MVVHPYPAKTSELLHAERRPDVFILDMEAQHDALSTIKQIQEAAQSSKVVLLCGLDDKDCTRDAFAHGVDGVILKVQPAEVVLAVLEGLYAPVKSLIPVEVLTVAKQVGVSTEPSSWPDVLTEREREIIRLVAQGHSNKEIADKLSISDSTVRHHMTSIFDKVGVSSRQKLLVQAHQFQPTSRESPR